MIYFTKKYWNQMLYCNHYKLDNLKTLYDLLIEVDHIIFILSQLTTIISSTLSSQIIYFKRFN